MRAPLAVSRGDAFELGEFLRAIELSASGVGESDVDFWVDVDVDGRIVGSTGFELDGDQALLRGVAVHPSLRGSGRGTELARFALDEAAARGATHVWTFSRRHGSFWEHLGFASAEPADLAAALPSTHQVRAFTDSGQLRYETAWSRPLPRIFNTAQDQGAGSVE